MYQLKNVKSHDLYTYAMADPGWGICPKCPPPSHLVEESAILVIKILNFMSGQDQFSYTSHENMHILLVLITVSPETEAN